MLSVFSKRLVVVPVAGLLLSAGVNAMSQAGQDLRQQQTGACLKLDKPPVECPNVSCIQVQNEATLSLIGDTTIDVTQLKTLVCRITQPDSDKEGGYEDYPVKKVCPSESSSQCGQGSDQKGYQCGVLTAEPIESTWSKVSEGSKTGNVKYQHLERYQITLHGGDSLHKTLPCGKISVEQVMAGLPSELQRNFTLGEAESAISGLIAELEVKGTLKGEEKSSHRYKKPAPVAKK